MPARHRSYCSICGLHLSFTLVMEALRARPTSGDVSGRVGATREGSGGGGGGGALLGRAFAQGLLAVVALALPPARVGVDAVGVRGELRQAVPLHELERGLHILCVSAMNGILSHARLFVFCYYRSISHRVASGRS